LMDYFWKDNDIVVIAICVHPQDIMG
jgi:hypothetical protein